MINDALQAIPAWRARGSVSILDAAVAAVAAFRELSPRPACALLLFNDLVFIVDDASDPDAIAKDYMRTTKNQPWREDEKKESRSPWPRQGMWRRP